MYQVIINLMPPHDTYIEPFLGSAQILKRKAPAKTNVGIDLDPALLENPPENTSYYCENGLDYLENFKAKDRTVIYCDPPYPQEKRTSRNKYKYEFTEADHDRFLSIITKMKDVHIIVSSYETTRYKEKLKGWFKTQQQVMTRGGARTETVWCNFQPDEMHYHRYAGENSLDRQRIQRKALRWKKRFKELPAGERQAVMAALLSVDNEAEA